MNFVTPMGQNAPPEHTRNGPGAPKKTQTAEDGPEADPGAAQDGPRGAQDGPRTAQGAPKAAEEAPRTAQNDHMTAH